MQVTYTGVSARLNNYGLTLTVQGPDDFEESIFLPGEDVREFYGCNPAKWIDMYGEDESMMFEAFELVNGIKATA